MKLSASDAMLEMLTPKNLKKTQRLKLFVVAAHADEGFTRSCLLKLTMSLAGEIRVEEVSSPGKRGTSSFKACVMNGSEVLCSIITHDVPTPENVPASQPQKKGVPQQANKILRQVEPV